ncbi:hypothetical protein F4810DRAFT_711530 [Camillea tinctor]|nr:hypothetical protein F4810DRAFT_711530 [Camillea tinctor]
MSTETPNNGASEAPDSKQSNTDPVSEDSSGQTKLPGSPEDTQEMHVMEFNDDAPFSTTPPKLKSPEVPGVKYLKRPETDTAEDIAAAFKYQRPPLPSTAFNISTHPLGGPGHRNFASVTEAPQLSYKHDPAFKPPSSVALYPGLPTSSDQEKSHSNISATEAGASKTENVVPVVVSGNTVDMIPKGRPPFNAETKSRPVSVQDAPGHPSEDSVTPQQQKERQQRPYDSPLSSIKNSKAIADVCDRARAQAVARHHPTPRKGASRTPTNGATSSHLHHSSTSRALYKKDHRDSLSGGQAAVTKSKLEGEVSAYRDFRDRRPRSQASNVSNISKPRIPRRIRKGKASPTLEQSNALRWKLADAWNNALVYDSELKDSYAKKVTMLKEQITGQNEEIEYCNHEIAIRDDAINALAEEKEKLMAELQSQQDRAARATGNSKKLEEEVCGYRDKLDRAIEEQQSIFRYCRAKCNDTIAKIRKEEEQHRMSIQEALTTANSIRGDVQENIGKVIRTSQQESGELKKNIESLTIQLEERQKEVEREKEHTRDLNAQLVESRKKNEEVLQSLLAQNEEILEKARDQRAIEDNAQLYVKQDEKIETILQKLDETRSSEIDMMALAKDLRADQDDLVSRVIQAVKDTVSNRHDGSEDNGKLQADIESIRNLCESLMMKILDYDIVEQWQRKFCDIEVATMSQKHKIEELEESLSLAQGHAKTQCQTEQQLRQELTRLKDVEDTNEVSIQKVNALTEQVAQLREIIAEKSATITQRDDSVRIAQEQLRNQTQMLKERDDRLESKRLEYETYKHKTNIDVQTLEQAILQASSQKKIAEEQCQVLQTQLAAAETAQTQLQEELEKRQSTNRLERLKINDSLEKALGMLTATTDQATKIMEGFQLTEDIQKALKPELDGWLNDRLEIGKLKQVVENIKKDQPNTIEVTSQLKELVDIQKKLSRTKQHHEKQLAEIHAVVSLSDDASKRNERPIFPEDPSSSQDFSNTIAEPSLEQASYSRRRVVVKSPISDDDAAAPISIEQERVTRRQAITPRGIIKAVTQNLTGELEGVDNEDAAITQTQTRAPVTKPRVEISRSSKVPPITYSTYNRPVAGSIVRRTSNDEESNVLINFDQNEKVRKRSRDAQVRTEVEDNSMHILPRPENPMERPIKRQREYGSEQIQRSLSGSNQGARLSRSMSQYFASPMENPEMRYEPVYHHTGLESERGGPLVRKPKILATYGSQSSVTASADSQESFILNSPWSSMPPVDTDVSQDLKQESQDSQDRGFKVG